MFGVKNDSKTVEVLYIFKISEAKRLSEKRNNSFKKVGFYSFCNIYFALHLFSVSSFYLTWLLNNFQAPSKNWLHYNICIIFLLNYGLMCLSIYCIIFLLSYVLMCLSTEIACVSCT